MSIARPFPARVIRQSRAQHAVTAMSESLDGTDPDPAPAAIDPAAYAESAPALYVYRQCRGAAEHVGVVCEIGIRAFVDGQIRGHESVQPQRVEALVRHHATSTAPPDLVTLLHHAGEAFTGALEATCRMQPILDFSGPGGLRQTVWRLPEGPATAAVTDELAAADHYIADGHHRVAAALEEWRLAGEPADAGLVCVVHPMDGLHLSAFHRRVSGPVDPANLTGLLGPPEFHVRAVEEPPEPTPGMFGMYVGRRWFQVSRRNNRSDGPASLDVSVLQTHVLDRLARLLPDPSYAVEAAPARTPLDELTRRCDADGGALFTLAPPPLETLTGLADAGGVMPPKTTYFAPKPCAGIFLRP